MLDADVATDVGDLRLRLPLQATAGQVIAVLGPNGSGKTTLLRALAGLLPGATLRLDGVDRSAEPPERRPVGFVFQDNLLFPHLTVLDNVAYGVAGRRVDRRRAAHDWLARVGLADRAADRPGVLSGGQAQRVALARALAREPQLLLLDEPLAALDPRTRVDVRRDLHRHLEDFRGVAILVTHDPVDAAALADHVVVLDHGAVVQAGTADELAARPRDAYVAEMFGTNLVPGAMAGGVLITTSGRLVVASDVDGPALAVIPPTAVSLHRTRPEGSPRNVWAAHVEAIELRGDRVHVRTSGPIAVIAAVTPAARTALELSPGGEIWVAVKATEIAVYPV